VTAWHVTEHLVVDDVGHLFERYRRGWHWRGPVAEAEVSPGLEPELAGCKVAWADRIDSRAEQLWAYQLKER
jgi:hypothetical protein